MVTTRGNRESAPPPPVSQKKKKKVVAAKAISKRPIAQVLLLALLALLSLSR
jgi:hypothetical protein